VVLKDLALRLPAVGSLNASLKAIMVERDAARTTQRYERLAELRGWPVSSLQVDPDQLRARLGDRPIRRQWPRPQGGLHIFLAFGTYNWEEVLPGSLEPFGRVTTFDYAKHGYDPGRPDWIVHREQMNRDLISAFDAANRDHPVDIMVCYLSGLTVSRRVLDHVRETGAVVVNFCFDDKVRFPGPTAGGRLKSTAEIAASVDLNLTSDPRGAAKYAAFGGLALFHPEAADPALHRPEPGAFIHDVSFIGARYGDRPAFIEALRNRGVEVACFGRGWPRGPVATADMGRIYSASRVNLGFGGIGYSSKLTNLKGRDFEVPMSGGLYLTQHNPELAHVYRLGQEILTYRDVGECAHHIRNLLADPAAAERIRNAGRARALSDHTYDARWSNVLRILGALRPFTDSGTDSCDA
jgi:hypothetical protein